MHASSSLSTFALLLSALPLLTAASPQSQDQQSPRIAQGFVPAFIDQSAFSNLLAPLSNGTSDPGTSQDRSPLLQIRQTNNCPAGYNPCTNLNQPAACCALTDVCSADFANHVACCPSGASCTGTVGGTATPAPSTATTGGFVFNSATSTTAGVTFITTAPSVAQITAGPQSTVPNYYFPFLYIPTTFANAQACSSYYSSCQTEYASCTSFIGGSGGGGAGVFTSNGVTVQAATTAPAVVSAISICQSLSQEACFGLQLSNCATATGATGDSGATGVVSVAGANTRWRGCEEAVRYAAGVGVAVGLVGQVLGR
ncbi:MAG: hypothetical protein MMC33_004486 [Icmadophila ericetorum]|nr:hypothetical protein [Icmadophila ericetorum]